jgi:protein-L-isoaspartate(D-aspartate) O-methyltransferase
MSKPIFPTQQSNSPSLTSTSTTSKGHGKTATKNPTVRAPQAHEGLRGNAAARQRMVQRLQHTHGIAAPSVLNAMNAVDRHSFVDSALAGQAYEDTSLPIGFGQTISKPQVVARMLQLLLQAPMPADAKVLEIGTGCGYQAAVLAQIFSKVYSIERISGLHHKAHQNLIALHHQGAQVAGTHLILGDGMLGYAPAAPYHAIIAAAGGEELPPAWVEQLAPGGRIVAPITQTVSGQQALVVVDKTASGQLQRHVLDAVHFVPLKSGFI